ncbi:hypothetical protein BASA50_003695 [Batrachochytrium salamandrivorans]|uniref:Methyltransferase domain-containing protein n=1 Tax=Batrachochytrium salamandrivorans TaxID=1357716 RepID=A0ABQ8FL15_9FUNG|nr:hypothetical protein BASA60_007349 [Batrachochytrium salamandrivorans]KAH6598660.1 hypothetical protein BASA50_003695 [Batrachochytrium salamandrivorans]
MAVVSRGTVAISKGRLKRLIAACDGSIHQAACELRWLTEAVVYRRIGSLLSRRKTVIRDCDLPVHTQQIQPPQSVQLVLDELSLPSVIDTAEAVEHIAETRLSAAEQCRLDRWIDQRVLDHKPLQYILGTQPFAGLDIAVRPPTLIPRWETEEWTVALADQIRRYQSDHAKTQASPTAPFRPLRILELCSGSGCISLALAHELGVNASITAVDIAPAAVLLARYNQRWLGLSGVGHPSRLRFIQDDIFHHSFSSRLLSSLAAFHSLDPQDARFDMIVANPPYISPSEYDTLDPSVKSWEDKGALLAIDTLGIRFYQHIELLAQSLLICPFRVSHEYTLPRLVFEIGHLQGSSVQQQLGPVVWSRTELRKDSAGFDRVVLKY